MNLEMLHRYIAGDATPEEKEEVTRWLDADKKNMKEFLAQRKLYDISIWQQELTIPSATKQKQWTLRTISIELTKIAAIFILAFTVLYSFLMNKDSSDPAIMQTIFVPPGQRAELTLTDGTKVWLNAKTTFTFPNKFTANTRNVTLDGEGYFNVTRDTEKPFLVQTEKYNIKVLGTEFNVTAYSGSPVFETALLKGAVEVSSPATYSKVYLKPNTRTYERNGELRTGIIEHQSYFLWKEGLICFFDEPVGKMIEKLELYYDVKIDVRNTELLKNRYSGKFRTKDGVEHVLKVLQLRHRFTYTKDNDLNLITIK
ncbi:FecR family protein [Parabacteroides sp. TM07-1AC]|jgi:ferric-dicitrate binding protein FerR (iron transport regulator)|uniref:FecR family protein n=1 Tax=Parabacteroides sp. TM07-1AC TaxID=2292363 RepID=UPI000EFEF8E2|nr:FecR family protein [Parabacteroides sp. TM07-1AC]RHU26284.1 FecR family protein [Parabacteroides sp. TM07-1AC]